MCLLAQVNNWTPDDLAGFIGLTALFCLLVWAVIRWLAKGAPRPDPWDEQVAHEIERTDAPVLCHRCLNPHDELANFCPECGAPVGAYTNWLPYPYLFSVGHLLRTGTSGDFKRSPLTIIGFLLFSLAEYAFFAPVYWFMFLKKLSRPRQPDNSLGGDVARETQGRS